MPVIEILEYVGELCYQVSLLDKDRGVKSATAPRALPTELQASIKNDIELVKEKLKNSKL